MIADLAAEASWELLAGAAGKGDLRIDADGDGDPDDLIEAKQLRAELDTPTGTGAIAAAVARLERALEAACALVDSYLLARYPDYEQPARGSEAPTPVTVWTVDLALERLFGPGEGEQFKTRADNARKQLMALASGDLHLPGDVDGDGDADHGGDRALYDSPDPVFTRESLAGFVGR